MTALTSEAPSDAAAHGALAALGGLAALIALLALLVPLPIPAAFAYATACLLTGWGTWRLAARRLGPAGGVLVRALSLAAAVWLALGVAVDPWGQLAAPAGLLVLALGLLEASHVNGHRGVRALALLATGPAAYVGLLAVLRFPPFLAAGEGPLHLLVAGVVGVLVLTRLAGLRRPRSDLAGLLAASPVRNGLATAALLGYLLYRPHVERTLTHAGVFEWAAALAVLTLLAWTLRRRLADRTVPYPWESSAKRHAQDVTPRFDPLARELAHASRLFVEAGEGRDRYEALWRDAYARAGLDPTRLTDALRELDALRRRRGRRARRERTHALVLEPFRETP